MRELRTAVIAAIAITLVFGLAYPLVMTGAAQVLWPNKADGDPTLIAKDYSKDAGLFQSRPSVTGYAADATFFNNQGPNQKDLADQLKANADDYLKQNPGTRRSDIPADAVTTSASGIDPHISKDNAEIQARRVARVRNMPIERVKQLIDDNTDGRFLFLGDPGINVLELNLALDKEQQ